MGNNFLSATANFDDFINQPSAEINNHVQKNNEAVLKKVFNFFQTDSKILLVNGFAGVGKKQVAEHSLSYLDKETITLKYVCTPSTLLDDVLLSFLMTLKQKIPVTKASELDAIETIRDKVEYFFSNSKYRFVFVFYNFDSIRDKNKTDILNYIYSVLEKESFKIVICARTFDTDIFPADLKYVKVVVKALSKTFFETYLKEFGVKVTPAMLDQLYRLTRGYFFSTCICAKYMVNQELALNDFIVQYTNSGESFDIFLAKSYYRLIVGTTKSAFNLFVKLNHGLNLKLLQSIGSYPEVVFKTLSDNFYIYKKGKNFYPNEFLKIQLEPFIREEISSKRLVDYYNKQLELLPDERDILISRASLQEEIAHCEGVDIDPAGDGVSVKAETEPEQLSASAFEPDTKPTVEVAVRKPVIKTTDYENVATDDLYSMAKEAFNSFNYVKVIEMLTAMLDRNEIKKTERLYDVYDFLAKTYSKLTKWQYSLYYYELLEKYYTSNYDVENVDRVKFECAYIYYQSYKIIEAIKILKALTMTSKSSDIIVKSDILLGNVALSANNKPLALEYFSNGLKHVPDLKDDKLKMELFFKYAILSDENGDINSAVDYYQNCINIGDKESKYLALAYSNLGDLFNDNNLCEESKGCYMSAYEADKIADNPYGMYYALTKIIELTDKSEKDTLVKLAIEAKECALKTDDYNALLLSAIQLGDIYYDYPEPEKALAEYLALYNEGVKVIEEPNFSMIKSRIEDIRARLGKEKFESLAPNYV